MFAWFLVLKTSVLEPDYLEASWVFSCTQLSPSQMKYSIVYRLCLGGFTSDIYNLGVRDWQEVGNLASTAHLYILLTL